MLASAFLTLLF